MAATVIDGYSTELAQVQPPAYAPMKPNQAEGRIRIAYFTKVFGTEAAGTDLALCRIPKGARLIRGCVYVSASTGSATIAIGLMAKDGSGYIDAANSVSDATGLCLVAAAITTTAEVPFLVTQALYQGYEAEKELYLTLTTAAAAMASQTLKGYLMYVVD